MNDTATNRPPTVRQLEARLEKARKVRSLASEKLRRAHAAFAEAFAAFENALSDETLARGSLSLAREGKAAEVAAPPAPETLTSADEED